MRISLYEHNQTAYESALSMLAETGKAAIVHPTGTGKSFIGFKLCEDFPDQTVCWLSPSEYIFKTQLENLKSASDGYEPQNVKFYTYAKLMLMSEDELSEIHPDYIILDEFHRCGAQMWGAGVQRFLSLYPQTPILGLSATNIRYLDNQRDMADELFDGNVASEMTLGEAIVRGILNPPKYVLSVFSYQKDLEKYKRRVQNAKSKAVRDAAKRYLDALRRALDKADGLDVIFDKHMTNRTGKYIVFCANFDHMREMMDKADEWFARVDKHPHLYSVYSDDPTASKSFADFKADHDDRHLRLLFCIDALNEGIHVENVSGVILLRPTVSPIIYKQQIGRALSASKTTDAVIFDIVMNIENLYSIDTVEEEMRVAMTYYRSFGEGQSIVNEQFQVIDELCDCRELFEKLNDTLTASWDVMYGYAKAYYESYGNLDVPRRYKTPDGYSLGNWIFTQRKIYRGEQSGILGEDRIAKLNKIGMIWDGFVDQLWKRNYSAAQEYYAKFGTLNVPAGYVTDAGIQLGSWICNLRTYRKSGSRSQYLTPERISALDAIGMIWDVPDYQWVKNYGAAARYHREHGDLNVPIDYVDPDGIRLGIWLKNMRYARKGENRITDEQIRQLDELDMIWDTKRLHQWEKDYAEAKAYYEAHGNLDVPVGYKTDTGFKLGDWLRSQRVKYADGKMKAEQTTRLNAIGMIWQKADPWEVRFALAEVYYREHGDLKVPAHCNINGISLTKWVNEQKQAYRGKRNQTLSKEQIQRLEAIGIEWGGSKDSAWEQRYEAVKKYFDTHGDLNIPKDVVLSDGKTIGKWLTAQRKSYKEGKLSDEQITKLNAVGMIWELTDSWEIGFAHAQAYFRKHGDLLVPVDYVCEDGYRLGNWLTNQKSSHNNPKISYTISEEQTKRLESIGIMWTQRDQRWWDVFELAAAYSGEHGDLNVPVGYKCENGVNLWEWLRQQRTKYHDNALSAEQIQKLNGIGMDWLSSSERDWENNFAAAEEYFRQHGHLNVPVTYRTENGLWLGRWITRQRRDRHKLKSTGTNGDQAKRLEQIGMIWDEHPVARLSASKDSERARAR